jgi:hypothetical protein
MSEVLKSTSAPRKIGVYCLANDVALEWFEAMVRSLRKYDPTLPLTVIPYNDSIARLKTLQPEFGFSIMDESAYTRFDAIADRVAGQHIAGGTFRKLSCYLGEYETFLFLDSDIVVTRSLQPFFNAFETANCDFVYFDTDMSMAYTPDFAGKMMAEYGAVGFNSGAFIARRGGFSEAEIMAVVASGEKIRDCFPIWGEQPFLNYLVDVTRHRKLAASALVAGTADKPWARIPLRRDADGEGYVDAEGHPMPFIHWAGCEWPTMFRPDIFLRYRTLGMGWKQRTGYRLNFYYRRFRRQLKDAFEKSRWLAGWVARREERRRQRLLQSPTTLK